MLKLPSVSPKVFPKLLSDIRPLFHLASFFQIIKHASNAMRHAMYDCAWMKCLCIRFTFMVFLLNLPHFHPCILRGSTGAVFFFSILEDIVVSMLAHHIMSRFLENRNPSCSSLYVWNTGFFRHDFTTLTLLINSA